ncbi:MAG: hypothetical protein H0S85_06965 [Desulfovibrionaceae bacterium]|jgi:hypothetical protein|nr:hypothetical protein [Desulfovibrionaceae bacterium]
MAQDHDAGPPWPGFVDALSTVLMMMVFFTLLMVLVVGTLSYIVALKDAAPTQTTGDTQVVASSQAMAYAAPLSSKERLEKALSTQALLDAKDLAPNSPASVLELEKLEMEKAALKRQLEAALAAARDSGKAVQDEKAAKLALEKALARIAELEASRGKDVEVKSGLEPKTPEFVTRIVRGLDPKNRIIILYNKLTSTLEDATKQELLAWLAPNKEAIAANGLELTATLNFEGVPSSTANSVSFKRLYGLIRVANEEGGIPKSKIKFRALEEAVPGTNQVVISVVR